MKHRPRALVRNIALILCTLIAIGRPATGEVNDRVLYRFKRGSDGLFPGNMVADSAGNLYGITYEGGIFAGSCQTYGCGTVFELEAPSSLGGTWTKTTLYRFDGGTHGFLPVGSLLLDHIGNLYGTTQWGGQSSPTCATGCGVVFELTPPVTPGGTWLETVLHAFTGNADGSYPTGLIADPAGNLYGVTAAGGNESDCGTVFQLTHSPGGQGWDRLTLYAFNGVPGGFGYGDGCNPNGVTFGGDSKLYGVTLNGGYCNPVGCSSAIFQLSPSLFSTSWMETIIYRGGELSFPLISPLISGGAGALYGTTISNAYELSSASGTWIMTDLHDFNGNGDGTQPTAGVTLDQSGNLYGTTGGGGSSGDGIVYRLTVPSMQNDPWSETILHDFTGGSDGVAPAAPLILGKSGVLYGTTLSGGNEGCQVGYNVGCGTVFAVNPSNSVGGSAGRRNARY